MDASTPKERMPESVRVPVSGGSPLTTAFGITLLAAGLVTHLAVSVVGFVIVLCGAVGWWREVLPHESEVEVPVKAREGGFLRLQASSRPVDYLRPGVSGHRVRIPSEISPYSSGVRAGLAGGVAMAVVASLFGLIADHSIWYPVNLLAAGVVPSLSAATADQLRQFSAAGLGLGLVIHGVTSLLVGLLYAVSLPMFPRRAGLWSGLITPVVWTCLIAGTLDIINPTLSAHIQWAWFIASQIAFGVAAGFVVARTEKIETMQTWPLAHRAGIEALGRPVREERNS